MKTKLLFLAFLLACFTLPAATVRGADLRFLWDDTRNAPGSVQSYRLFEVVGGQRAATPLAVTGDKTVTITNVAPGSHTYVVTAFNVVDSDPSNAVTTSVLFGPVNLRVEIIATVTVTVP